MQKPFQSALAGFVKIARSFMAGRVTTWAILAILLVLLNACAPMAASQPFYLITPEGAPSLTPFQPAEITPEPTWPVLLTPTALPSLTPSRTPTATATLTPSPLPPTPAPSATPTPVLSEAEGPDTLITYNINALWDYAGRGLEIAQEITYPNRSGESIDVLLLGVNPNLWQGTFNLNQIEINRQPVKYTLSGQSLSITLPEPLAPEESLLIGLNYNLALPYSSGTYQNFGYTARQTNLIDWFPFVPPYLPGEGWLLPEPWVYGENFAYPMADFYIGITFADSNPPIVAASAPASQNGDTLRYAFRGRTFTLSASNDFETASREENGITVTSYYFPEHYLAGQRILVETVAALRTYS